MNWRDSFEFLGDTDQRNQYILDLGEKIPAMPAALKTDTTRVHGCMSVVHLFWSCSRGVGGVRLPTRMLTSFAD